MKMKRIKRPKRLHLVKKTDSDSVFYLKELMSIGQMSKVSINNLETVSDDMSHVGFTFDKRKISGVMEMGSNRIVGCKLEIVSSMMTFAYGDDSWFSDEFEKMVPVPKIFDLRKDSIAAMNMLYKKIEDFFVNDFEEIYRLSFEDFLKVVLMTSLDVSDLDMN